MSRDIARNIIYVLIVVMLIMMLFGCRDGGVESFKGVSSIFVNS